MRTTLFKAVVVVLIAGLTAGCGGSSSPVAPAPIPTPAPTPTPPPIFTMTGAGNQVFDMPSYVARVRIQGTWNRSGNSNFIVRIGGRLIVNEILRDPIVYDGTHLTGGGGVTETVSSGNIAWIFTEIR